MEIDFFEQLSPTNSGLQTHICAMCGTLPVAFSDTYMQKLESDILAAPKPTFYRRYV